MIGRFAAFDSSSSRIPMRILTRYVLSEFLKVFLLALAGLTGVVILAFLAKEAIDEGLGPGAILRLIPYVVPQALQFAVPGTALLAATSVYGRLSGGNEIVAVKAAGISPLAVISPVLVLVTLVSMATVWLNDIAFSWGRSGVERVLLESLEEIVYARLRHQQTYETAGVSITVDGVAGRRLIRPRFVFHRSDERGMSYSAQAAELWSDASRGAIVLRLFHPRSEGNAPLRMDWPDTLDFEFELADFSRKAIVSDNPSQMPLAEVPGAATKQEDRIARTRQELATLAGFALIGGQFSDLVGDEWTNRTAEIAQAQGAVARLKREPHRRWASGFSCLSFVLVGIPMAIRRRHAEFLASFFACFLPILLLYYPLLVIGLDQAKNGALPPIAVWTGNVVFALWGLWLLRRVVRY
jgi:lipopolysaccharide export system permease protein